MFQFFQIFQCFKVSNIYIYIYIYIYIKQHTKKRQNWGEGGGGVLLCNFGGSNFVENNIRIAENERESMSLSMETSNLGFVEMLGGQHQEQPRF